MSIKLGTLIFARFESTRLPGKALIELGGLPLLERVIRRAQLLPWPVFLATTDRAADDQLVSLAAQLDVLSFRGSSERVLERAVLAAEAFELDAFIRLCGDRPLFSLDDLEHAASQWRSAFQSDPLCPPDLVSNCLGQTCPRGLTTEIVRTHTLRQILDCGVSHSQQEHLTQYFYENTSQFKIIRIDAPRAAFRCPGFALDTESDLTRLKSIFDACPDIDLSPADADRIFSS
jgi:spore coat polysaccharide biosynthesis protein SpsF